jgi:3'(2'), 5'-bisphosphate nucleotidase
MLNRLATILHQAGKLLLERRASGAFTFTRHDVTVQASVDIEAHNFLLRSLSDLTPGVPVLSEEDASGRSGNRPESYWLIDPLDGTASFVDGYAGFVTQAALIRACRPVLAGVHAPALGETFLAEKGAGATRNAERCRVSTRSQEHWTLTDNYPQPRGSAAALMRDWNIAKYLECGSIGLKICRVADGSADLFVKNVTVRDWDVGAPELVLEEAGGLLRQASGQAFPYVGTFERRGLIACASDQVVARVAAWLKTQEPQ